MFAQHAWGPDSTPVQNKQTAKQQQQQTGEMFLWSEEEMREERFSKNVQGELMLFLWRAASKVLELRPFGWLKHAEYTPK